MSGRNMNSYNNNKHNVWVNSVSAPEYERELFNVQAEIADAIEPLKHSYG